MAESGKLVAAACHGTAALLNTRLSDGRLISGQNPPSAEGVGERLAELLAADR